jgi:hypothetical protein
MSILSERDSIQCWINTPIGYYVGSEKWGNSISSYQFKNIGNIRMSIHKLLDKLKDDLGAEIYNTIDEVAIIRRDIESYSFVIAYNNYNSIAIGDI